MHYRKLGKTNFKVSEVSLGAWQIGGAWGDVSDVDAERVLHAAIENGINFIDTAACPYRAEHRAEDHLDYSAGCFTLFQRSQNQRDKPH
jgi:aryl-alcohol dehydrogenase-like predicted oxidoreductase